MCSGLKSSWKRCKITCQRSWIVSLKFNSSRARFHFLFARMHQEWLKLPKINVKCTVVAWMAGMLCVMAVVGFWFYIYTNFHSIWMKVRGNWQPGGVWCSHINLNLFQISEDKNVTTSEVKLTAGPEDNGKNITCRAENTQMSGGPLAAKEASLKMDVMCKLK